MAAPPKAHETSLDHSNPVLQRWCPIQDDVEDYFKKSLEEVLALQSSAARSCFYAHGLGSHVRRKTLRVSSARGRSWCLLTTWILFSHSAHHDHRRCYGHRDSTIQTRGMPHHAARDPTSARCGVRVLAQPNLKVVCAAGRCLPRYRDFRRRREVDHR